MKHSLSLIVDLGIQNHLFIYLAQQKMSIVEVKIEIFYVQFILLNFSHIKS